MGRHHIKRLAAPETWPISRKGFKLVAKSVPGPHSLSRGMPLILVLKEVLKCAATTKEAKKILNTNDIKIDGKTRKEFRFPVGIFDTIEIANTNQYFRVVMDRKGKICLVKIKKEETLSKPCKVIGKTIVRGKLQLNLYDGRNITLHDDSYKVKVNDSVMLSLPEQKISGHLKLDKKAAIFLTGGKHIGDIGNVDDVVGDKIIYKNLNGELIETSKKYAFVVGDNKPLITVA